jgi:uncharacterized protein YbjT (DUF2867 family)
VRVQIALGDLADPRSFRNALRGVQTVIHLAAAIRDQPTASIEEVNGIGTWRLVRASEQAGVERFVFFSALGASPTQRTRFFQAKALAERAVARCAVPHVVFAPSIVYAPGDPWLRLQQRLSLLPAVPVSGSGGARFQPIWAQDVADCVMAVLDGAGHGRERFELAGPDTLSYDAIVRVILRAGGHRRRLLHVPLPAVRAGLRALEWAVGAAAFATWEEAELMEVPMVSPGGTADAEALGVTPQRMRAVLGG